MIKERIRLRKLLVENPDWKETLREALNHEAQGMEKYKGKEFGYIGWEWQDVHTYPAILNKMVVERILDLVLSTRSSKYYKLRNPELVKQVLEEFDQEVSIPEEKEEIPSDLFSPIIGYEDKKKLIRYAIEAEKRVHLLFTGVPSSSKTLFLLELRRLPMACYTVASTLTGAGLAELLFSYEPKILLLDEVDRIGPSDFGILNSLLETGIISEVKYHKTREKVLSTKVFAAGIKVGKLPQDFLSRFATLYFPPYTEKEFIEVGVRVLEQRENISPELGQVISREIWNAGERFRDIRQAVYVARMCGNDKDKVREIIRILKSQYPNRR